MDMLLSKNASSCYGKAKISVQTETHGGNVQVKQGRSRLFHDMVERLLFKTGAGGLDCLTGWLQAMLLLQ